MMMTSSVGHLTHFSGFLTTGCEEREKYRKEREKEGVFSRKSRRVEDNEWQTLSVRMLMNKLINIPETLDSLTKGEGMRLVLNNPLPSQLEDV